jgi:hypothetical protein
MAGSLLRRPRRSCIDRSSGDRWAATTGVLGRQTGSERTNRYPTRSAKRARGARMITRIVSV